MGRQVSKLCALNEMTVLKKSQDRGGLFCREVRGWQPGINLVCNVGPCGWFCEQALIERLLHTGRTVVHAEDVVRTKTYSPERIKDNA